MHSQRTLVALRNKGTLIYGALATNSLELPKLEKPGKKLENSLVATGKELKAMQHISEKFAPYMIHYKATSLCVSLMYNR